MQLNEHHHNQGGSPTIEEIAPTCTLCAPIFFRMDGDLLPHLDLPLPIRVRVAHNDSTVVIPQSTWGGGAQQWIRVGVRGAYPAGRLGRDQPREERVKG